MAAFKNVVAGWAWGITIFRVLSPGNNEHDDSTESNEWPQVCHGSESTMARVSIF